ncbi:MAG: hypothetical protein MPN21_15370 [Thermoanaerobaculia bacterium]|nr:hypothetical protein [Thermoanaerobaculia bacterium]
MSRRPAHSAYALFLALIVVLVLSAAAFLVAAQMQVRMASLQDEGRNVHLRNLVDSGVALGLARISEDRYWSGSFTQAMDGGFVECTIELDTGSRRKLLVEAEYGGEQWRYLFQIHVTSSRPRVVGQQLIPPGTGGG